MSYRNFDIPIAPDQPQSGWAGFNQNVQGGLAGIIQGLQQRKAQEDAIKFLMLKAQLEQQGAMAQEQAKQQATLDMQQKRIKMAKENFPQMFGGQNFNPVQNKSNVMSGLQNAVKRGIGGQPMDVKAESASSSPDFNPVKSSGYELNPNFAMTGEGDMMVKNPNNDLRIQERQDQFNQREWDKLTKEVNPLTTSGRNPLGMAMKANYNANRALSTLSNPMVTNQEAGNVMADIASIYQNGSPTQFGMSEQAYHTLNAKIAGIKQYFTGKPQDALTPEVKNRLLNVLYDMKRTNFDVLKQNLAYTEKAKAKLIKAFPQEWQDMKETLMSDAYSGLGKQSSGGDMNAKIQKARDAGYSEEEIQKYLQGKM